MGLHNSEFQRADFQTYKVTLIASGFTLQTTLPTSRAGQLGSRKVQEGPPCLREAETIQIF